MASDQDFTRQLDGWLKAVEALQPTVADKARITGAGAKVFAETLKQMTPKSTENHKHLRDGLTYKPGYTIDKLQTGNTDVSYKNGYLARTARIVNGGKKQMSAKEVKNMHYIDRAREASKGAILAAEAAEYGRILKERGGTT